MKTVIITFALLISAQAAQAKCEKQALKQIYKLYKNECGGYGSMNESCELLKSKKSGGNVVWHATCSFSGEPDYNDYAEAVITLDASKCSLVNIDVKDCYND